MSRPFLAVALDHERVYTQGEPERGALVLPRLGRLDHPKPQLRAGSEEPDGPRFEECLGLER